MLTIERTTQLRDAITTLRAAGRNPSYHAIHSVVRGKYATLCADLRELAAAEAQGLTEPGADTGGSAPAATGSPADSSPLRTPQAQLAQAEAAFIVATAELVAATTEAAQWTQHYLSIEPRIRLGTLAAQDPSIAPTREAFAQARAWYRQAWGAYTDAQEDVQAAQHALQTTLAQAAEAARRQWAQAQRPELFDALEAAKGDLDALRDALPRDRDERGEDLRRYWRVQELEKQIQAVMAEAPHTVGERSEDATAIAHT